MEDAKTEQVPDGATLTIDSTIADQPATPEVEQKAPTPGAFMTPEKLLKTLKQMVGSEQITEQQARDMRRQFGITNNYFTKPKTTDEQRRAKRQSVKESKRTNRYNDSTKGQKRNQGRGS